MGAAVPGVFREKRDLSTWSVPEPCLLTEIAMENTLPASCLAGFGRRKSFDASDSWFGIFRVWLDLLAVFDIMTCLSVLR
jgi:hypothetical protein